MGRGNESGRALPRNTAALSFVVFCVAIVMINCAQGSDAGLILWCSGAMVFVATAAQASWLPPKRVRRQDSDLWVLVGLAKLLIAGGLVAIAMAGFPRSDSFTLAVLTLAATLLMGLGAGLSSRPVLTLTLCLSICTAFCVLIGLRMPLTVHLFLLIAVFVSLITVAVLLIRPPRRASAFQEGQTEVLQAQVLHWADLIALPLFLSEQQASIYLTVRCAVGMMAGTIGSVQNVMLPKLVEAHRAATNEIFRGLVARASLGVMLIGGALGFVAMMVRPIILPQPVTGSEAVQAFHILLTGALVPIVLGISPALMSVFVRSHRLATAYAANIVITAGVASFLWPMTAVEMAQAVAIGQTIGALVLAWINFHQLGLLPPITALLYSRIRLRDSNAR